MLDGKEQNQLHHDVRARFLWDRTAEAACQESMVSSRTPDDRAMPIPCKHTADMQLAEH